MLHYFVCCIYSLGDNSIGDIGVQALAEDVQYFTNIQKLE